jgi:hypothetical protein
MVSVIERCCRTCVDAVPDHYRGALRCVAHDRPVSARDVCDTWWLNEDVVGGKADGREIVVVSTDTYARPSPVPAGRT